MNTIRNLKPLGVGLIFMGVVLTACADSTSSREPFAGGAIYSVDTTVHTEAYKLYQGPIQY